MNEAPDAVPIISIVVPTLNRASLLPGLVRALGDQRDVGPYEIIVVDDSSTDDTEHVLQRLAAECAVPLRTLRTAAGSGNPAGPRNLGWRAARAPLVAFIDDDCVPRPGWLSALVQSLDGADVVQGLTDADPVQAPGSGPFSRFIAVDRFSWKFETCNIGYRRDLLERLEGFDEGFPLKFGEDIDLGWRATAAGARLAWQPDAVVFHRVERSDSRVRDWWNCVRYARHCELAALTVKKHPGLREHLYRRYFYKRFHVFTLAALAGVGLTPVLRAPAAWLVAPWIYYRVRIDPRAAPAKWLWAVLPMGFVVDAAEVTATVKGAVRYRTPIF